MDRSDMIFELLKGLDSKQDRQSEVLTSVEADLKYHIRRTDLIEESLKEKAERINWRKVGIVLGVISTAIGIVAGIKVL